MSSSRRSRTYEPRLSTERVRYAHCMAGTVTNSRLTVGGHHDLGKRLASNRRNALLGKVLPILSRWSNLHRRFLTEHRHRASQDHHGHNFVIAVKVRDR